MDLNHDVSYVLVGWSWQSITFEGLLIQFNESKKIHFDVVVVIIVHFDVAVVVVHFYVDVGAVAVFVHFDVVVVIVAHFDVAVVVVDVHFYVDVGAFAVVVHFDVDVGAIVDIGIHRWS